MDRLELPPASRRQLAGRRVLVTGATGFIGSHLVQRLLAAGADVRALVLPGEAVPADWPGRVDIAWCSVTDPAGVAAALAGCELVFHLAAKVGDWGPPAEYEAVSVGGTRHVLGSAAQQGVRAILVSSIVVYGDGLNGQPCPEERPFGRPFGPYSRSKQRQELIAGELAASAGLAVTIVRPANVYGPGCRPWVIDAVAALRRGPSLIGGGRFNAGLVYVDNVVEVLLRAAVTDGAVGRVYNAADDTAVTWQQYFSDLARAAHAPPPRPIPRGLALVAAHLMERTWRALRRPARPQITLEAYNLVGADLHIPSDRARAELGYVPLVDYPAGLRQVTAYMAANPALFAPG